MELEATLAIEPGRPAAPSLPERLRAIRGSVALPLVVGALALAAWHVRHELPYTSGSDVGYLLGVIGGSLMAALLLYPLRKRMRSLAILGPLRHWFRFHLAAGIAGPVIVLFHSTFRVGSFNAAVALASMLLVVASGIVGRFIYRKIHHGLYGSRATLEEVRQALARQTASLAPLLERIPEVRHEIERFSALASQQPEGRRRRVAHFLSLGWKRLRAGRRIDRAFARFAARHPRTSAAAHGRLRTLIQTIDAALRAAQRTAQFSTYERLFSLWHVVHVPFLWMLVITAIVHVVAVHAY